MYEAELGNITIALTGDAMINRRMSSYREPAFLQLVDLLRGADATFANLEQVFHEWEMAYGSVGMSSFQVSHPSNLAELQWLGIDAVSTAMNHAWDYGEAGLLATLENCKRCELPQAGSGVNLGEARAPVFLDTPRGRVAFMSASTTHHVPELSFAGPGRPDFPGKPGINARGLNHYSCVYSRAKLRQTRLTVFLKKMSACRTHSPRKRWSASSNACPDRRTAIFTD